MILSHVGVFASRGVAPDPHGDINGGVKKIKTLISYPPNYYFGEPSVSNSGNHQSFFYKTVDPRMYLSYFFESHFCDGFSNASVSTFTPRRQELRAKPSQSRLKWRWSPKRRGPVSGDMSMSFGTSLGGFGTIFGSFGHTLALQGGPGVSVFF